MKRGLTRWFRYVLEQLLPPVLCDSAWFMRLPMRLAFGRRYREIMRFKTDAVTMSPRELQQTYARLEISPLLTRPTDLNEPCINQILKDISTHDTVLDVGCGRGYLAGRMADAARLVVGSGFHVDARVPVQYPKARFIQSDVQRLSFPDRSFDVVICSHTLEHVQDLDAALSELRRVARSMLILVVPRERPYRYTLNLHLHFFPYVETLLFAVKLPSRDATCVELAGDWYYREPIGSR